MSQIRASQIKVSQIRATEISPNHRELHGAIFSPGFLLHPALCFDHILALPKSSDRKLFCRMFPLPQEIWIWPLFQCDLHVRFCMQLGRCRSVTDFEKLNRVGEGTYGIVCTLICDFCNSRNMLLLYFQSFITIILCCRQSQRQEE